MKIYFTETSSFVAETDDESTLQPFVLSFELEAGKSTFALRYSVVDNVLVDNYLGMSDEDIVKKLQEIEEAKVLELVAKLSA